ncbi:MAG TPA: cytochrome-c oxidase, cbb3-type subunit I, partial [Rhodobacteraceae bacterium]|nr:cytochrome-c oxidase, cbb3-type subunit I [Paracoccaceae bacterium]
MWGYIKLLIFAVIAITAGYIANNARDLAYLVSAIEVAVVAGIFFIFTAKGMGEPKTAPETGYMDDVIRVGAILTVFWAVVGFTVGVWIAFQLAYPELNFAWADGYLNFGRLRPLHTSAVIFAFGGTGLITTSFYVVQRTSGARMFGGNLAWFVFWGYQLFIL